MCEAEKRRGPIRRRGMRRALAWGWICAAACGCGPQGRQWLAAAGPWSGARPSPSAAERSGDAQTRSADELLALLPPELRESAAPVLAVPETAQQGERLRELDAAERGERLRDFSREADARIVPFLLALLEHEDTAELRGRALHELARWPEPAARAALARAAASDPSARTALLALQDLYELQMKDLLGLLEQRLALGAGDDAGRGQLRGAHEHWLTVARGGLLPAFLREPPAVFAAAPADRPVRAVLFGDFGSGSAAQRHTALALRRAHQRARFDFGLTLGDNFYPAGMASPQDGRWASLWTELYEPLGIPFYPSLGNHDWSDPSSPAAQVLHRSPSWVMPATRYSFTAGAAQFFALDTAALSAQQLEWLRAELERSSATWKIVYGHHPIRSHGAHGDDADLLERLLPVLSGRADLYLAGHDHDMQLLAPEAGVQLAVIGSGGASVRPTEPGARSLFCASRYGFGELALDARRLSLRFVDSELELLHELVLERDARGARLPAPSAPALAQSCLPPRPEPAAARAAAP